MGRKAPKRTIIPVKSCPTMIGIRSTESVAILSGTLGSDLFQNRVFIDDLEENKLDIHNKQCSFSNEIKYLILLWNNVLLFSHIF